jgi:gluconolactonase
MADALSTMLETTQAERLATGFGFTEGPLWDPTNGCYYFVDLRRNRLHRITPGKEPEVVRENTGEGNGTTFDLQGRIVMCEGGNRRITRMHADGRIDVLMDRFEGKRLNRPNDVVCRSDGSIYFTDPGLRVPLAQRELPYAGIYRIAPNGAITLIADFEYPNGLAFSPDERRLYVSDTGASHAEDGPRHIRVFDVDPEGRLSGGEVFATCTSGAFDGFRLDEAGRIWASAGDGVHCYDPDGTLIGRVAVPEVVANVVFGGPKRNRLYICGTTSLYALMVQTNGARTF